MGELFALSADRSTRLAFAPAAFAEQTAREDAPFGGWGVACYEGRTVQRFREACSPEGSPLAQLLADLETETSLLVA
ncbi:MAG: hypothetical protein D6776_01090, partial [Planctomycetota bacterium]